MNVLGDPRLLDAARCDDPKLSGYLEVITQVPPLHVTSDGLSRACLAPRSTRACESPRVIAALGSQVPHPGRTFSRNGLVLRVTSLLSP